MKRIFITLLLVAAVFSGTTHPVEAAVGDVTIGAMTWFSWWKPVWRNYDKFGGTARFDLAPGFISGPVVSTQIDESTTISAVFLYYFYNASDTINFATSSFEFDRDVHKIESDIIINKQLSGWLKYFFGVKYQGYFYNETQSFISGTVVLPSEQSVAFHNFGPGGGVGFTVNILENLYFLPNISLIMLFGYEMTDDAQFSFCLGGNITASLAYVTPWNITIALGGRFQHLHYLYHGHAGYFYDDIGKRYDQLFGVQLALAASF